MRLTHMLTFRWWAQRQRNARITAITLPTTQWPYLQIEASSDGLHKSWQWDA